MACRRLPGLLLASDRAYLAIPGRRPDDRADARRADPYHHARGAPRPTLNIVGGVERSPCPLADPRYRRRQGDDPRRAVQQSEGRHAGGNARAPGRRSRDRAAGLGAVRNPRRGGDDPARQGLSRRGPGADPADRKWRGPDGDALRAHHHHPRPRPDRRRRGQARRLSEQADRG